MKNAATDSSWDEAARRHASAVAEYVAAAERLPDSAWAEPVGQGKWSPAEITEHLSRTYEVITGQLRGGEGLAVRSNPVVRAILRHTALRWIRSRRRLPSGAKAPHEIRPAAGDPHRDAALARFSRLGEEFARETSERRGDPRAVLTHHLFGSFPLAEGVDFIAIHIEHHGRQVAAARGAGAP